MTNSTKPPSFKDITEDLLRSLNEVFPDSLSLATRKGWNLDMAKGAREVIDLLSNHLKTREEKR